MDALLLTVLISGAVCAALGGLFAHERSRGVRYAAAQRAAADRYVVSLGAALRHRVVLPGTRSVRQTVHYALHRLLTVLLSLVRRAESAIRAVLHINKSRARRITGEEGSERTNPHFAEVAEHKRTVQLSDEEKQQRRDDAMARTR